ncbi:Uu.00g009150.m01.CDS01 [Anthostomella pinea]|uniref:Uu.00g009150.m01.CDS01 n=1 Tax=Anthostomella pinea TaxID=933095 RepID=A0AAI8VXC1_9PEZI|nr:Uu.00g009150.m01.CDS01 [Anthostomella pinea]
MERVHNVNPFAKRDEHTKNTVITYKVLTTVTWLLSVVVSFYYTFNSPHDGNWARRRIWQQNDAYPTAFRLNSIIASIYWLVLFILQGGYIAHLFSGNVERVNAACSVGSHFILNNLFHFAFVMLFVRSAFGWAELIIILNFANLSSLYFRHPGYARFIHQAAVSGPLAWTFVAIYWNGAIMVPDANSLVARIFGNIFIWSIMVYGLFFIVVYKDYTMGFNLSVLSAAIGVSQFLRQVVAFQWIFAFTIMAVLFVATVVVAIPAATGKDFGFGRTQESDTERAPLLAES